MREPQRAKSNLMTETRLSLSSPDTNSSEFSRARLCELLSQNLDFHAQSSNYASHNFHSFPAKFPPQLPRHFIEGLTEPGDLVLDPMQGSGTTMVEAQLANRRAIGMDIDPLALLITRVKTTPLDPLTVIAYEKEIHRKAYAAYLDRPNSLLKALETCWEKETRAFVDYWFDTDTQLALIALIREIEKVAEPDLNHFFKLAISGIIITKSGGVSLALDLAHTRPHRAKVIYKENGEILEGLEYLEQSPSNLRHATKTLRSPFGEFEKRVLTNLKGIFKPGQEHYSPRLIYGNAEELPVASNSIDLIVTSPPYASNAIDYMRAHKFSLVWLGYPIQKLGERRGKYIGGEMLTNVAFEPLPEFTTGVVSEVTRVDKNKGQVLQRYYSEMARVLQEMYRVLKPGKSAVVVVGNSVMRNINTQTQHCLAEIGRSFGFEVPVIGVRNLDRNKRMLPAGNRLNLESQIQQRMHEEYVIGFIKP